MVKEMLFPVHFGLLVLALVGKILKLEEKNSKIQELTNPKNSYLLNIVKKFVNKPIRALNLKNYFN